MTGTNLKKELLYFDEIFVEERDFNVFVHHVDQVKSYPRAENVTSILNEILFLNKEGYIKIEDSTKYFFSSIQQKEVRAADVDAESLFEDITNKDSYIEWGLRLTYLYNLLSNLSIRRTCSLLNEKNIFNVKPILDIRTLKDYNLPPSGENDKTLIRNHDVLNVVFNRIPIPDDTVSWEQILDFKQEYRVHKLALDSWISEIGSSTLNAYEIEQKMEYLLASYEEDLRLCKMNYNIETMQIFVTSPLELLKDILTLNWSKIAAPLFELKKRNVDLLIGETKALGREVAYISKIKDSFNY